MTPRSAVLRFAQSYGEYLDGQLPATRVAEAATVDVGIRIAPIARTGRLHVISMTPAPLGRASHFILRDRTHTIRLAVIMNRDHDKDVVESFSAPDLDSMAQALPHPISPPRGSDPVKRTAQRFLSGYLAWVYGHGKPSAIIDAAPRLRRELSSPPPWQSRAAPDLQPQIVAIGIVHASANWTAEANIADDQRTYTLDLTVVRTRQAWQVSHVQAPN